MILQTCFTNKISQAEISGDIISELYDDSSISIESQKEVFEL